MSDTERDKKLDELLEIIKKAPAMNGGFTKMSDAVSEIQECNIKVLFELQTMKTSLDNHTEKLDVLQSALYDPDAGLYRRVTTALEENKQQNGELEEISEETKILSEKVAVIEAKNETLEQVAGTDLKELRSAITGKKHLSRAIWAFAVAAIGGLVKIIWDVVPHIF